MTDNLTSQAVTESMDNMRVIRDRGINTLEVQKVIAICEKYKRMEDVLPRALAKLEVYRKQTDGEYGGGPEFSDLKTAIQDALSFDPLRK